MGQIGFIKEHIKESCISHIPKDFLHILIEGKTGCGKTSSGIKPLIRESISNTDMKQTAIILDYKGDMLNYVIESVYQERESLQDLMIIGEKYGEDINLLYNVNSAEVEDLLNGILAQNDFWEIAAKSLFTQAFEILSYNEHLQTFGNNSKYTTISEIYNLINDSENTKEFLDITKELLDKRKDFLQSEFRGVVLVQHLKRISKITNSLVQYVKTADDSSNSSSGGYNGVRMVLSSALESIARETSLNNPKKRGIISALEKNRVVYINLSKLSDFTGKIILSQLYSKLQKNNRDNRISIIADEYHRLIPSAIKDEKTNSAEIPLDVLRSFNVRMISAIQDISQLEKALEDNFKQFMVNIEHHIQFVEPFTYLLNSSKLRRKSIMHKEIGIYKKLLVMKIKMSRNTLVSDSDNLILYPIEEKEFGKFICYDYLTQKEVEAYVVNQDLKRKMKFSKVIKDYIPKDNEEIAILNKRIDAYIKGFNKKIYQRYFPEYYSQKREKIVEKIEESRFDIEEEDKIIIPF